MIATAPPIESVMASPSYLPPEKEPVRRSLLAQAIIDTFTRPGARAGIAWIGLIVCLAVFAPFLASSFPIAMKLKGGKWSYPLFANL